jgi:hypothetical protein
LVFDRTLFPLLFVLSWFVYERKNVFLFFFGLIFLILLPWKRDLVIYLSNLKNSVSNDLPRINLYLRLLQEFFNNQTTYGTVFLNFYFRIMLYIINQKPKGLIENDKHIFVVNIIIYNVLVHAMNDGLNHWLKLMTMRKWLVSFDYCKHELRILR